MEEKSKEMAQIVKSGETPFPEQSTAQMWDSPEG